MLFKKNKKSNYLLGLDLTNTTIKILELSKRKQQYQVENYFIAHLNQNDHSIETLIQNDTLSLKNILSEHLKNICFNTANAAIAIADNNIMNKIVRFDKSCTDEEIENQIALDYMKYFSPLTEAINYDFYHLGKSRQYPDCIDIWITAVKKALVNNCIKALSEINLHVATFDIASLAIIRACHMIPAITAYIENNHLFAVININPRQATLSIYHHAIPLLTRTISLTSFDNNTHTTENPLPSQSILTQQMQQILESFYANYHSDPVKHLLICGDGCNSVALCAHLNAEFNIPCSVANPFCNVSFADHCDSQILLQQAHQWMICCGLAMRTSD